MATITQRRLDAVRTDYCTLKSQLQQVTAQRDELERKLTGQHDVFSRCLLRTKAQRDELLAALKQTLASWATENALTYEVVEEANAAISKADQH